MIVAQVVKDGLVLAGDSAVTKVKIKADGTPDLSSISIRNDAIKVFVGGNGDFAFAVGGEGEIGTKKVSEVILAAASNTAGDICKPVVDAVKDCLSNHVKTGPWDTPEQAVEFEQRVMVYLFLAVAPTSFWNIAISALGEVITSQKHPGDTPHLYPPPPNPPHEQTRTSAHIYSIITDGNPEALDTITKQTLNGFRFASGISDQCRFPVRICTWPVGSTPKLTTIL